MALPVSRRSLLLGAFGAIAAPSLALAAPAAAANTTAAGGLSNEDFSIVVLPDTQWGVKRYHAAFTSQIDWILANRNSAWNVRYVAHVVEDWEDAAQWTRARSQLGRLTGVVPRAIAPGNHDVVGNVANRDFSRFNQYFPYSAFDQVPTAGSAYPTNRTQNTWHRFSAGGTDWAIISLGWNPSTAELDWANYTVAAHPNRQFIVNTHQYLSATTGRRDSIGDRVWNGFASKHANIVMVVCGHYANQAPKRQLSHGVNGNPVHEIVADYQDPDNELNNSYLRIMKFRPANRTVEVKTWSNLRKQYLTDAANQFTLTDFPFRPGTPRIRRHIVDVASYEAWRFRPGEQWYLPDDQLQRYPVGPALGAAPQLIRVTGTAPIYLVDNGRKRHVTDARSLKAWRWTSDDVRNVTQAEVNAIPTGPPVPDYPYFVKVAGTAPIYLLDDPT